MPAFNHMNSYLRFCIDSIRDQQIAGKLFSQRFFSPVAFSDLGSVALFLDEVFDQQNFPQAFQRNRTFLAGESDLSNVVDEPGQGMTPAVVCAARGRVVTFDVLVVSRRSSSWQGTVSWLDENNRQEFHSFLELMRMINTRLLTRKP